MRVRELIRLLAVIVLSQILLGGVVWSLAWLCIPAVRGPEADRLFREFLAGGVLTILVLFLAALPEVRTRPGKQAEQAKRQPAARSVAPIIPATAPQPRRPRPKYKPPREATPMDVLEEVIFRIRRI